MEVDVEEHAHSITVRFCTRRSGGCGYDVDSTCELKWKVGSVTMWSWEEGTLKLEVFNDLEVDYVDEPVVVRKLAGIGDRIIEAGVSSEIKGLEGK